MVRADATSVSAAGTGAPSATEAGPLLQDGDIDLALGSWPSLEAGFRHATLFDESFTLLMRSAHPLPGRALTLEEYLDAEHVLYRPSDASELAPQSALSSEGILARRKVVLTSAHFVGLAAVVASSDWMLTLPCRLAAAMKGREPGIAVAPLPFVLPPFPVLMQWHERVDSDGGNDWLRGLLTRHLGNLPMPAQIARRT
jgi:DNA-binding transcriptional LysR family regulator